MKKFYGVLLALAFVGGSIGNAGATCTWNCSYLDYRECRCMSPEGYCLGQRNVDNIVAGKLYDQQIYADNALLISQYTDQLANNFTNEIANMTTAAYDGINTSTAMLQECNDSFALRNQWLMDLRNLGANVTEEDLLAKDINAVTASYANGYGDE